MGGEWLRATRPAYLVNARWSWPVVVGLTVATTDDDDGLWIVTPDGKQAAHPKFIIVRPLRNWTPETTEMAHEAGQLVIADLDDDLWSHEDAGDWSEQDAKLGPDRYNDWFLGADAFLCSTPVVARAVRRQGFQGPVVVAPNCHDSWSPEKMGLRAKGPDLSRPARWGTRLWLSGRMQPDLELYDSLVLPAVIEQGATWVHLGATPGYSFPERGWPSDQVEQHESTYVQAMANVLGTLDVGVICLGVHPYNKAKTLTHPMDLAACGLPLVAASDDPLYKSVPGRVPATREAVAERLRNLRHPGTWQYESQVALHWCRDLAVRSETLYLAALSSLVEQLSATLRV